MKIVVFFICAVVIFSLEACYRPISYNTTRDITFRSSLGNKSHVNMHINKLEKLASYANQSDCFDYVPLLENAVYEFEGYFLTNSSYFKSRYKVSKVDENYGKVKIMQLIAQNHDGKGKFEDYASYLYVFNDNGIYQYDLTLNVPMPDLKEYFSNPVIDENYKKSTASSPMNYYPLIKDPIEMGTKWLMPFNQNNHYGQVISCEITGINVPIKTLVGTLGALEITKKTPNGYYEKHYFVKNIGLIKMLYGEYNTQNGEMNNPYTISNLTTLYGFNGECNGKIYEDLHLFNEENKSAINDDKWMDAYADVLINETEKPRHITVIDVNFDGIPELFLSQLGTSNSWIYKGYSYKDGNVLELKIPEEFMPMDFELYKDKNSNKLIWLTNGMFRDGYGYYDNIWELIDFSDLSNIKKELFFGWNEQYDNENEKYFLLGNEDAKIEMSLEEIEKKKKEIFSNYELIEVSKQFSFVDEFIIGNDDLLTKENVDKKLLFDFFSKWENTDIH